MFILPGHKKEKLKVPCMSIARELGGYTVMHACNGMPWSSVRKAGWARARRVDTCHRCGAERGQQVACGYHYVKTIAKV